MKKCVWMLRVMPATTGRELRCWLLLLTLSVSQLHRGIRVAKGTEGSDCSSFLACFLWKEQILRTVCVKCLKKTLEVNFWCTRTVFIFQSTFRFVFKVKKANGLVQI